MASFYSGRVAVVTGAAAGLGRALATELTRRGSNVALIDTDADGLAHLAAELRQPDLQISTHTADVANEQALSATVEAVIGAHKTVEIVINNAGISASLPFAQTEGALFERILGVNFFGVVNSCRLFLPYLRRSGVSHIVNVSSCFAWLGYPGKTAYASSKAAIKAFSESLRIEESPNGIGVTLLYPGPLRTGIVDSGPCLSEDRRKRESDFLQKTGLDPLRVARTCLDRLPTNPHRIVVGTNYAILDAAARISPDWALRLTARGAARMGF